MSSSQFKCCQCKVTARVGDHCAAILRRQPWSPKAEEDLREQWSSSLDGDYSVERTEGGDEVLVFCDHERCEDCLPVWPPPAAARRPQPQQPRSQPQPRPQPRPQPALPAPPSPLPRPWMRRPPQPRINIPRGKLFWSLSPLHQLRNTILLLPSVLP